MPNAPQGTYNALGKNGQFINVVPDQGLVLVRMGNAPNNGNTVPYLFNDEIWERLNALICGATGTNLAAAPHALRLQHDQAQDGLTLQVPEAMAQGQLQIVDALGRVVWAQHLRSTRMVIDLHRLPAGSYRCVLHTATGRVVEGFVKQ
jgi:hypothetical protein